MKILLEICLFLNTGNFCHYGACKLRFVKKVYNNNNWEIIVIFEKKVSRLLIKLDFFLAHFSQIVEKHVTILKGKC